MQKIIMCKGLPASGKSTWAKDFILKNPNFVRINNDDLRRSFFCVQFDPQYEKVIRRVRMNLEEFWLKDGKSLIIDNMNLTDGHQQRYSDLAKNHGAEFEIKDFTDVSLQDCLARDKLREASVGQQVIRRSYAIMLKYKKQVKLPDNDPNLFSCIICDLDGTLALIANNSRGPYEDHKCETDIVNKPIKEILTKFYDTYNVIILLSGRDEGRSRNATINWLIQNDIPYDHLFMRPTGDVRPDYVVKKELYEKHILGKYNVKFCLDDRNSIVDLFRGLGLPVFQVNYGDF